MMEDMMNDRIREQITWVITDVWTLHDRQDLLDDCFAFVEDEVMGTFVPVTDSRIMKAVCKFLQMHCADAISSQNLEDMANAH